jgi:type IV pilus assembly protein PilO
MGKISDSLAKLSLAKWIFILSGISVAFLAAYWYLFYSPKLDEWQKEKDEQGRLEVKVRELRIVAANVKRFQEEAAKLRQELNIAMAELPTSKEIPSLLSNISSLGKESGLEFLLFRPAPEVNREFYAEIPVEIRVRGTYAHVGVFFDKVAKLPRIVNITSLSMDGAKEHVGRWEIMTSCTATAFKYIEQQERTEPGRGAKPPGKAVPAKVPLKK